MNSKLTYKLLLIPITFIAFACQSPTKYKPKNNGEFGYSSKKLTENKYRVSFEGNSDTDKARVEKNLMYRIAELTKKKGYSHFQIVSKDTDVMKNLDVNYTGNPVVNPYATGFYSYSNYRYPYYAYGTNWAYASTAPRTVNVEKRFEVVAYVVMYKDDENDKNLQSANEVMKNLKKEINFAKN